MLFGFTNSVWSGIQSVAPNPFPAITMLPTAPRLPGNHCKEITCDCVVFHHLHALAFIADATRTPPVKHSPKPVKHPADTTQAHRPSSKAK